MRSVSGAMVGDRYLLEREIGRGAMGAVWRAQHVALAQPVAIKFLHGPELTENSVKRFLREARAAAAVRHPHVVSVTDVGTHLGTPFLVMEWISGIPVDAWLRQQRRSVNELIDVICMVLEGLDAIHALSIVHRDIKPQNVLVSPGRGDKWVAKIVDFGVSRMPAEVSHPWGSEQSVLTKKGQIVGTPVYAAPEQLMQECDARSDLYSVAVTLYEALSGNAPFRGTNLLELAAAIATGTYESLSTARPDLPQRLVTVVQRAMSRDRDERPATAMKLHEQLRRAIDGTDGDAAAAPSAATSPTLLAAWHEPEALPSDPTDADRPAAERSIFEDTSDEWPQR